MNLPKQLVILGGGASLRPYWDGDKKDLGMFDRVIPNSFCCGLNYSYQFVKTTFQCGVDETFWNLNWQELNKLPLYVAKLINGTANTTPGKNVYFLKSSKIYNRDLFQGVYSSTLVGLFALSLMIQIMQEGEIYLLGYDYGPQYTTSSRKPDTDEHGRPITHWYQGKVEHRGIGKINWYTSTTVDPQKAGPITRITNAEKEFRVYKDEPSVKIFNVGLGSTIPTFPKISYEDFLTKIETTDHNHEAIREELKQRIIQVQHNFASQALTMQIPKKFSLNQPPKGPFLC